MGMSEAAIFISLSATVDQSLQAIALSGLFLSSGVGMISGLAASSAVLQLTLRGELERRLQDYPEKQTASQPPPHILRGSNVLDHREHAE
jgi:hypothetical protein